MSAPRTLRRVAGCLCLTLLPTLVRAEPPLGAYSLTVSAQTGLTLPASSPDSLCRPTASGTVCVKSTLTTDAADATTGTADLIRAGNTELDLELTLDGRVSGTTAKPKVRLAFTATGTAKGPDNLPGEDEERDTLIVTGEGRMSCRIWDENETRFLCNARARLCLFRDDVNVGCVRFPFRALLPAARTPLDVDLDIATDAHDRVAGFGRVRLEERPQIDCTASGKYAQRTGASTLRLECSDGAAEAQLALQKAVLARGGVASGKLVFKVAGQKGRVDLAPPPPEPP